MDNISGTPPPSYSPPTPHSLITIVAPIPPTIPRPIYWGPQYVYHGLPFDLLPPNIQSFLTSHGLDNVAHYDPVAVDTVRSWLTEKLLDTVSGVSHAIVLANVRYNLLRTMYPASDPSLCLLVRTLRREFLPLLEQHMAEHLTFADALVWADVAAREGGPNALTVEEALHYRWLQTQPAIDLVATRLVELYEWSAAMWMLGWRSDGITTYQLQSQTAPEAGSPPYASPVLVDAETAAESVMVPSPAPPASPRPDTPRCTIPPTLSPVHMPPVRPSTPPRNPQSASNASSPQTPRSTRSPCSPPATPGRSARTSPAAGITQSTPRNQRVSQSPSPPMVVKYATVSVCVGVGRVLPLR
ncbi:hypothetical protein B0H13DRAFT_2002835, partial [Mycena leptocephala]